MHSRRAGPRRAAPTSSRWVRSGGIDVARIRIPGRPAPKVLLVADRGLLDAQAADGSDLALRTAEALLARSGGGLDLDLIGDPIRALGSMPSDDARLRRLWRYDLLIVLLPYGEDDRTPSSAAADRMLRRIVARVRVHTSVLLCHPSAEHGSPRAASDGSGQAHRFVTVALDYSAGDVGESLVAALDPPGRATAGDGSTGRSGEIAPGWDRRLDRLVETARRAFGTESAALNLLAPDDLVTVAASYGTGHQPARSALLTRAMGSTDLDVVGDTWEEPSLRGHPAVSGPDAVRFYAAFALESGDGTCIGALCLYDTAPHDPAEFDFTLLRDLALLAEGELLAVAAHARGGASVSPPID